MGSAEETIKQLTAAVQSLQQQLSAVQHHQQQAQIQREHTVVPNVPKPETFNGRGNIHSWIWSVEQYFATTNISSDAARTQYAVNLFRGNVATWMRSRMNGHELPGWSVLRPELEATFAPISEVKQARDRLAKLRQTKSVSNYASQFRQLLLLLPELPEDEKVDKFARGLKPEIAKEIFLRDPSTLDEAMRMAERYDMLSWSLRNLSAPKPSVPERKSDPMDLSAVKFQKLTPDERKNIMDNNGCLYCRKLNAGHMAKDCPEKKQSN